MKERGARRLHGLDLARALAFAGMVLVNFKVSMGASADPDAPLVLTRLCSLLDGRAAATFVVLAGAGASLGSRRARLSEDAAQHRAARRTLLRRGAVLMGMGLLLLPVWPADILHFYGVYLALGSLLLFAPLWLLGITGSIAVLVSFGFILSGRFFEHWDMATLGYRGLATPGGFLRNTFLDGFHPVLPWIAFYLLGMALGRMNLASRSLQMMLVLGALPLTAIADWASWQLLGPRGSDLSRIPESSWRWLFYVDPVPPLPLFVISAGATACALIGLCLWITPSEPGRAWRPWLAMGRLALSLYVAHVLVGLGFLEAIGRLQGQSLVFATTSGLAFVGLSLLASWVHDRLWSRGPLERILRSV